MIAFDNLMDTRIQFTNKLTACKYLYNSGPTLSPLRSYNSRKFWQLYFLACTIYFWKPQGPLTISRTDFTLLTPYPIPGPSNLPWAP